MRIVSLLPSATEIVCALGLGDQLVGVTHECDFPPEVSSLPRVTRTAIPAGASAAEIDRLVSSGTTTNVLDTEVIAALQPDLVLSQDLCAVCAVPAGDVEQALDVIGCRADVVSLDPSSLADVLADIARVGDAASVGDVARLYREQLQDRLETVAVSVKGQPAPRTFALEWADPPFNGGHWVPEMIRIAGGTPVLAEDGAPSVRVTWDDIAEAGPEELVFMPCGYRLDAAVVEAMAFADRPELAGVRRIHAVDADAYFSRPGPRLVDGVELLASVLHPDHVGAIVGDAVARIR